MNVAISRAQWFVSTDANLRVILEDPVPGQVNAIPGEARCSFQQLDG
jgi:hypothetical protein